MFRDNKYGSVRYILYDKNNVRDKILTSTPLSQQLEKGISDHDNTILDPCLYEGIDSDLGKFFTTHREKKLSGKSVYWIVLENSDNLNLLRMGVYYRLHPLVLEDIISSEGITKLDNYDTHLMLTIPLIFLKPQKLDKDEDDSKTNNENNNENTTSDQSKNNSTTMSPTPIETDNSPIAFMSQKYVLVMNNTSHYCLV